MTVCTIEPKGMKITDFLKLEELVPHGELVEQGLVAPLKMDSNGNGYISKKEAKEAGKAVRKEMMKKKI